MKIDSEILLEKFQKGTLSIEEEYELEKRIETDEMDLSEIDFFRSITDLPTPSHSLKMDDDFYRNLAREKNEINTSLGTNLARWWRSAAGYSWYWGYSLAVLTLGIVVGIYWPQESSQDENSLRAEIIEMKEMMMLSLLENESTTDRLKAVNLTQEMNDVSDQVARALINTLRHDENNNVRMATIQVLASYTDKPTVREGIIKSIQYQESPLVQLALAELMVAMNEKNAAKEFDSLWRKNETPEEVKKEIKIKMETLI